MSKSILPLRLAALVAGVLGATSAIGEQLQDFVPPMLGATYCWSRNYSDAHLAEHPQQKVTSLYFSVEYTDFPEAPEVEPTHVFTTYIKTRDRAGWNSGQCYFDDNGKAFCGIECDGGGFYVDKIRNDNSMLLDLESRGYIALISGCDGAGEEEVFVLEAEPDDKMFLLQATDPKACQAKFNAVIPRD